MGIRQLWEAAYFFSFSIVVAVICCRCRRWFCCCFGALHCHNLYVYTFGLEDEKHRIFILFDQFIIPLQISKCANDGIQILCWCFYSSHQTSSSFFHTHTHSLCLSLFSCLLQPYVYVKESFYICSFYTNRYAIKSYSIHFVPHSNRVFPIKMPK